MDKSRQSGLIPDELLRERRVAIIGCGAIGSFVGLALGKMGVPYLDIYDDDEVTAHNIPNQFFRMTDVGAWKVSAAGEIISTYSDVAVKAYHDRFPNPQLPTQQLLLPDAMVVATDTMESRRDAWAEFRIQSQCRCYIEARMGGEEGRVYAIFKRPWKGGWLLTVKDIKFYEKTLYSDARADHDPCTARSIIYNVLVIAGLVCRAYKGWLTNTSTPKEVVFHLGDRICVMATTE